MTFAHLGFGREITAGHAADLLQRISPRSPADRARCEFAAEFLADMRRLDAQIRDTRARLTAAVRASGTSLTQIFGVGPGHPRRHHRRGLRSEQVRRGAPVRIS